MDKKLMSFYIRSYANTLKPSDHKAAMLHISSSIEDPYFTTFSDLFLSDFFTEDHIDKHNAVRHARYLIDVNYAREILDEKGRIKKIEFIDGSFLCF